MNDVKRFDSSEGNVWKYVFDFGDAIAEAVLYKYESFNKLTVLCVSVQSGCPVGCKFCGTGNKFIRNLTSDEIVKQVHYCLHDMNIEDVNTASERFQIMFMSMGEPMLNMDALRGAIIELNTHFRNAELLVSTMMPKNPKSLHTFLGLSQYIHKIGLQFSIHEANDERRNKLIPYEPKYSLREIRDYGIIWNHTTNRPVYINYCISEDNHSDEDINRLMDLFSPRVFNITLSVICSSDETMKDAGFRNLETIKKVSDKFLENGYNVRTFNPAGQDDIGGGCGQLWYVQEWLRREGKK
ncbi:MAG: rRNA methyltransferase [Bacteroidetes bacterium HGW-Bacteroidetes-1]|jgi:23S rRNA (adenine2503-C2)-methyltransferase|nr:MAG: rRNA methyltransferase [Bacteroidetes bacterium HGW-Bacteroidetes-1]